MAVDHAISRRVARIFGTREPDEQTVEFRIPNPDVLPIIDGMRYNGQQWVDAIRSDRPFVPVLAKATPGKDMFGGSGIRTPPRSSPPTPKKRRRGGF